MNRVCTIALLLLAGCSQMEKLGAELRGGHEGYDRDRNRAAMLDARKHLKAGNFAAVLESLARWEGEVREPTVPVMRAQACLGMGRIEEAETHLTQAVGLAPKSAPIALLRAQVTEARGSWSEAAKQFQQAFLLDTQSRPALDGQSRCLVAAGKPEEALFFLQSEASQFGKDSEYWRNLANVAFAAQEFGFSAEYSAKALALGAKDEALVEQRLFSLCLDGDFATAVKEASRLPLGRLSPEVQITLGRGGLVVQQPAFAAAAIQEYLISHPTDVSAWMDLSRSQYLAGRIERALQAAERAVILEPDDPKAHALLGHALARLDRSEEAAAAYRQAHYYGADPEEARSWIARVESRVAADADTLTPRPAAAPGGKRGD